LHECACTSIGLKNEYCSKNILTQLQDGSSFILVWKAFINQRAIVDFSFRGKSSGGEIKRVRNVNDGTVANEKKKTKEKPGLRRLSFFVEDISS
jgi:hypothetical protein